MELDKEKIIELKRKSNLTWADIARITGLNNRQTAYDRWVRGNVNAAEYFAGIFNVDPMELIK